MRLFCSSQVLSGVGATVQLIGIRPSPKGMARALLHRSLAIMAAEGVTRITTRIMSRSIPQQRLAAGFGGTVLGVNMIFPGMYLN